MLYYSHHQKKIHQKKTNVKIKKSQGLQKDKQLHRSTNKTIRLSLFGRETPLNLIQRPQCLWANSKAVHFSPSMQSDGKLQSTVSPPSITGFCRLTSVQVRYRAYLRNTKPGHRQRGRGSAWGGEGDRASTHCFLTGSS